MKIEERKQADYEDGFKLGCSHRKAGTKPSWFKTGSPVSSNHNVGFLDGLTGKSHRYDTGKRKSALI